MKTINNRSCYHVIVIKQWPHNDSYVEHNIVHVITNTKKSERRMEKTKQMMCDNKNVIH